MSFNRRVYRGASGGSSFSGNFASVLPGAFNIMVSDQGVTNGATIIRTDQSGTASGDYSQAVATAPTFAGTLNGRATLLCNGTGQRMSSAYSTPSPAVTPWEVVVVVKCVTYTVGGRMLSDATDADVVYNNAGSAPGITRYAVGPSAQSNGLTVGVWSLVKARATNSTSDLVQAGSSSAVTGISSGSLGASANRSIGASGAGNNPGNFEYALVAYGPVGFAGAPFLAALDTYYGGLVLHP